MNNPSSLKQNTDAVTFEDEDIFDDSLFLAKFDESSFKESAAEQTFNRSNLNVSALCCDEELSGYDKLTGRTWIYPTNYPVRDYQFNIIKASMVKNTLVSLPTGLGKTFIAAVIMYNFYRWYPLGKIIFTAPTRPLVAQQINACYNIVALPPEDTIEMTGTMQISTRKIHWKNKRVFFATPQVIFNDIQSGICPADKIRCLVFDEAHRARGNYAYCSIVGALNDMGHKTFRVLALSATPGSKVEDVTNVIKSLRIAHLELRTENCIDVAPYSHTRKINTVIIQLGPELTYLRNQYVDILDGYARRLKQLNILPQNLGNLSKGRIVMLYKEYQNKDKGARHPQHNWIMKDFTLLIALYHGLELMVKHGSRVFLNFFDDHPEKSWIQSDDRLTALLERLRDDLGINPMSLDRSILPDGTMPEIPTNLCFGHPKFERLREIMMNHFKKAKDNQQDTRAIVFCEYRESVNLVHCLLLQCRPLITARMFVGQGASGKDGKQIVSQKQQLLVMRQFREGVCNVLVATCVAEEGLDVGSVDLIVCFDISTKSPVRLVQRCGRTGRERGGQVHILVTEGREHQTLMDCMRQRDGLNKKVLQSREVENNLYKLNPRMLPHGFMPDCQKMYITVTKLADANDKKESAAKPKKTFKDLRTMLLGSSSNSTSSGSNSSNKDIEANVYISKKEFEDMFPQGYCVKSNLDSSREYWNLSRASLLNMSKTDGYSNTKLASWLEWQRTLQKTINIGHTRDSEILSELLQYSDAKRFELPANTQNPTFNTQDLETQSLAIVKPSPIKLKVQPKKKHKVPLFKSPVKKDGDIRALFSTATKSTKNYTKVIHDLGITNDGSIPANLIDILVHMKLANTKTVRKCYLCQYLCDCSVLKNINKTKKESPIIANFLNNPFLPDIELLNDIDSDAIDKCITQKIDKVEELCDEYIDIGLDNRKNRSTNFDLDFDFDSPEELKEAKVRKPSESDKNFDIGNLEDIFADSSPEEAIESPVSKIKEKELSPKKTLDFFGLDSIEDIFADSDDSTHSKSDKEKNIDDPITVETGKCKNKLCDVNEQVSYKEKHVPLDCPRSPSLLSGTRIKYTPTSPILCSQNRKPKLSIKKKNIQTSTPNVKPQSLFQEMKTNEEIIEITEDNNNEVKPTSNMLVTTKETSLASTSNKSMFTITQLVEMINKTNSDQSKLGQSLSKEEDVFLSQIYREKVRSPSPILLTQAVKKKSLSINKNKSSQIRKNDSLIVLDSDSDCDETQVYDVEFDKNIDLDFKKPNQESYKSPLTIKRKFQPDNESKIDSPYFSKRLKIDENCSKPLSLQEKVIAALTANKNNDKIVHKAEEINFMLSSPRSKSQKENFSPKFHGNGRINNEKKFTNSGLEKLRLFKHDPKTPFANKFQGQHSLNSTKPSNPQKQTPTFDDSDDDFIMDSKKCPSPNTTETREKSFIVNHKKRKNQKKRNEFLDLEAELSDNSDRDSGDELSDESIGSIIDFICDDDNVTAPEDMHAYYLKSVKSPVRGVFKIPQLPSKSKNVLSQYMEEDSYEMDSFCVDSHIGLTQVNDVSELEIAEQILENRRKGRKKDTSTVNFSVNSPVSVNGDSPVVKRKNKRRISSDSDSS